MHNPMMQKQTPIVPGIILRQPQRLEIAVLLDVQPQIDRVAEI